MAKKTLSVTLYISEILVEIKNKAFLTGRSRDNGQNVEQVAHMQASDDDEDEMQLLNTIGNAWALLKARLGEFLTINDATANNILISNSTNLTMSLSFPSNFNLAGGDAIARGCDQYIIDMSLAEWFTITNKADADDYLKKAAADIALIREAANRRVRPNRNAPVV